MNKIQTVVPPANENVETKPDAGATPDHVENLKQYEMDPKD